MISLDSQLFYKTLLQVLHTRNVPEPIAKTVVESLVTTSLRGVDSHGLNLYPHYDNELKLNRLNINPNIQINETGLSTAVLDADNTFGHYAGDLAVDKAIDLASNTGVGVVSVKNSTHFGAANYFTDKIARNNMIGFAFTNTEALVNAFGSKEAFLGTNPFCFSAPMLDEEPFCLDMATSTVAWNKIKNYRRQNLELEKGWALDENGVETQNPHDANSLTAIGGYKGFGLGMVIEILCSGLASGALSKDIPPLYDLSIEDKRNISHFFIAIDVSKFISIDLFKMYMSNLATRVRSLEPNSNSTEVLMSGDKEKQQYAIRLANGIPMDDVKFDEFLSISKDFQYTTL
jgi:ureidoglycolate dehydrogenase (NAD+)